MLWCFHTRARQQDNDKTKVEPVHSYDAFHTRHVGPGVKGIIGMHRFNICHVVLSLSWSGVKTLDFRIYFECIKVLCYFVFKQNLVSSCFLANLRQKNRRPHLDLQENLSVPFVLYIIREHLTGRRTVE